MDILPTVKGQYYSFEPLAKKTWFRVGGPAEVLYTPLNLEDLQNFLKSKPRDVPVTILGRASNLLIRDGGIPGVSIILGSAFNYIRKTDNTLTCGAYASSPNVAAFCRDNSISGLEFLIGIPGTIGGALAMNAGAYGSEISDITTYAKVLDNRGEIKTILGNHLQFSYRNCMVPKNTIFVEAGFTGHPGKKEDIEKIITDFRNRRLRTQPVKLRTGGSTFQNHENGKAWELINKAGCHNLTCGGAHVSKKHCNFLINSASANANDIEELGEKIRKIVLQETGNNLIWEIRRIGIKANKIDSLLNLPEVKE